MATAKSMIMGTSKKAVGGVGEEGTVGAKKEKKEKKKKFVVFFKR